MKLKFLTSLVAAGAMLAATSAFALTQAQMTAINNTINAATTITLPAAAASALTTCNCTDDACIQFVVNAAKTKLGTSAGIASVRNLINALVVACPTKAAVIVQYGGNAYPLMKANIAAAAQAGLATAVASGQITATQANTFSGLVNTAAGIGAAAAAGARSGSVFQANQTAANNRATAEFQRSNQNNYSAP